MVALNRMREEDPTWVIDQSKELRQTIVHGQGEFHLRTLKWRLENNEKLQIKFEEPRIPYRETITKAARADYRHKKQSGGAGQFGEVHLIVEPYYEGMPLPETYKFNGQEFKMNVKGTEEVPLEWGGKLVFVNSIVGGSIDARFMPAILKGIMSRMEQGPLTGSYARDVRVIVYDGKCIRLTPMKSPLCWRDGMRSAKRSRMQARRFWNPFMTWKYLFRRTRWVM